MGMTIRQVSEKYQLPQQTLRYYERVGVIPPVSRTAGGIRDYSAEDLNWVEQAKCMRAAGLSIEVLCAYQKLFRQGDKTIPQRLQLLESQHVLLEKQKQQLDETITKLDYKIGCYRQAVRTGRLVWPDQTPKKGAAK